MIVTGVILILLAMLLDIGLLYTLGAILAIVGAVLWIVGAFGRQIGPGLTTTDPTPTIDRRDPAASTHRRGCRLFDASHVASSVDLGLPFFQLPAQRLGGTPSYRSDSGVSIFEVTPPKADVVALQR